MVDIGCRCDSYLMPFAPVLAAEIVQERVVDERKSVVFLSNPQTPHRTRCVGVFFFLPGFRVALVHSRQQCTRIWLSWLLSPT